MNRLLATLLAASLAVNLWLGWQWAATPVAKEIPPHGPAAPPPSAPAQALETFLSLPLPELPAALQRAGVSPEMLRSILWGRLKEKYAAKLAATTPQKRDASIWWRWPKPDKDAEARAQQRSALMARMETELAQLMGEPPPGPPRDPRYSFLSAEKYAALQRLERDYHDVRTKAQSVGGEVGMQRLQLVETEWRRDLATVLSPDELREYDVRFAPGADMLRYRLGAIDGTESEYRALLALEQQARSEPHAVGRQRAVQEAVRLLGRERAADYSWGNEAGYREVVAIGEKLGAPQLRTDFAEFRQTMTERAVAAVSDRNLSSDAKREALIKLAAEARTELSRRFPAAAVAEMDVATAWIAELEQGKARFYVPASGGYGTAWIPVESPRKTGGP